jgi:hypothetical protein
MTRHRFDPLSFIFGLLFAGVAAAALIGVEVVALRDLAWIAPSLLVIAGAALLFSSAGRSRSDEVPDGQPATDAARETAADRSGEVDRDRAADTGRDEVARASDAPEMGPASEDR